MLRLRIIEGLTLAQIGKRVGITTERVRQLLKLHFRLGGRSPAAKRRPPVKPRPLTLSEQRRMYRLARLTVMRTTGPSPWRKSPGPSPLPLARCSAHTRSSAKEPFTTTSPAALTPAF
jgi:hypothetical protein